MLTFKPFQYSRINWICMTDEQREFAVQQAKDKYILACEEGNVYQVKAVKETKVKEIVEIETTETEVEVDVRYVWAILLRACAQREDFLNIQMEKAAAFYQKAKDKLLALREETKSWLKGARSWALKIAYKAMFVMEARYLEAKEALLAFEV